MYSNARLAVSRLIKQILFGNFTIFKIEYYNHANSLASLLQNVCILFIES